MRCARFLLTSVSRTPNGIRTRAAALKGRCPWPLDDGGSTATAGLPVAPAVGDRLSIGDGRHWRQSRCRHRHRLAWPGTGLSPGRRVTRAGCACSASLALPVLVDELLGDRGLLAFLRDDKPRDHVREHT